MRTLLAITAAAAVVFTVWATSPTVARQHNTVSIDPTGMTVTKVGLTTEQYDQF
ncbi:MAG: hypothetical protein WBG10_01850 [Pseudolabrys sp.]|jgi:hypothetical protein